LTTLQEQCCLADGCYELLVSDSFNDGIDAPGGYVLRDPNGERIIDNLPSGNFGNLSSIAGNFGFCVPTGSVDLRPEWCDRDDLPSDAIIRCFTDPSVTAEYGVNDANSGYQWRFFEPNGSYIRYMFVSHANPSDPSKP
ncbi:MAG: hypothetical protein KDB96_18735, partial [Flavobacteriales bacterium]|nr:hypothetical protein [Flavobacteriales bacterium]